MKRFVLLASICILIAAPVLAGPGECVPSPQMSGGGGGWNVGGGHGGWNVGGGHGGCNILRCKDELKLTDDQVSKIKNINHKHRMAMIDLEAELQKAKLNQKMEAHSDDPSRSTVLSLAKEAARIKSSINEAKINNRFDIKDILTKEQLENWKKCQVQCRTEYGPGFGAGCGTGGGHGAGCGSAGKKGAGCAPKGHGFGAKKLGEEFCPKHKI